MKRNLRSEAAIKRAIKAWSKVKLHKDDNDPVVKFYTFKVHPDMAHVAEIDLRELVKKRKPLIGIKKQVDKIVRGSKKK